MDNRAEIRDFLATRRAKITPEQVGLPAGGRRRVPGLRREEVAVLAGVSPDWYIRLEKGHISGVSDDVLDAVARALQLSDVEREHLFNLARAAKPARTPRRRAKTQIPASVQRVLDSMTGTAAFVRNGRLDILASNALGRALYAPVLDQPAHRGSIARFDFLDPRAADYYPDYDGALTIAVALLRTEAGRNPHDKDLTDLIGELATQSEAFRVRWGAHDVRTHRGGVKTFNHPVVGHLELAYDSMELVAAPGLVLTAYTAEPATASADALALLASWAATDHPVPTDTPDRDATRSHDRTGPASTRTLTASAQPTEGEPVHLTTPSPAAKAPETLFTGDVYVSPLKKIDGPSKLIASIVRFTPGARTNWHSHALGQTLFCTDGTGLVVSRDGTVIRMRPGDTVYTPPGEEHWPGAGVDCTMSHIAMLEGTGDGDGTTWLEPVTGEQYAAARQASPAASA